MQLPGLVLARTFASPCFGRECKVRVATKRQKFIQKFIGTTMGSIDVHQDQCG
jgi:hypothetical protein